MMKFNLDIQHVKYTRYKCTVLLKLILAMYTCIKLRMKGDLEFEVSEGDLELKVNDQGHTAIWILETEGRHCVLTMSHIRDVILFVSTAYTLKYKLVS